MPFTMQLKEFHKVAKVGDVADGEMLALSAEGIDIMLARIGDEYFALYNNCSHADAMLAFGFLHTDRCVVECPLHEGLFDLRTGEAIQEPAEDPVEAYAIRIEDDDILVGPREEAAPA